MYIQNYATDFLKTQIFFSKFFEFINCLPVSEFWKIPKLSKIFNFTSRRGVEVLRIKKIKITGLLIFGTEQIKIGLVKIWGQPLAPSHCKLHSTWGRQRQIFEGPHSPSILSHVVIYTRNAIDPDHAVSYERIHAVWGGNLAMGKVKMNICLTKVMFMGWFVRTFQGHVKCLYFLSSIISRFLMARSTTKLSSKCTRMLFWYSASNTYMANITLCAT